MSLAVAAGSASVYFLTVRRGRATTVAMPIIGPHGEKRPADTLANALHVAKLSTGDAKEEYINPAKQPGGHKGGKARAENMTAEQRREVAQRAAKARWARLG